MCRGDLNFIQDPRTSYGLYTAPKIVCKKCKKLTAFHFSKLPDKRYRGFSINRQIVFANKCIGGTRAGLDTFCFLLNLPSPISNKPYAKHVRAILDTAIHQAKESMARACQEIRYHYNVQGDDIADILISCDGTWQRRGFSSLYGAVFVIAFETGKVLDYTVLSRHCAGCQKWENSDKNSDAIRSGSPSMNVA